MRPTELYLLLMPFSEIVGKDIYFGADRSWLGQTDFVNYLQLGLFCLKVGNDIFIICVYGIFCIMPADNFDYDDIKAVIHD